MQFKNLIVTSALTGLALGAANNSTLTTATPTVASGCTFSDFTATDSAQVAQVAACETAVGDITVQGTAFGAIDITGVQAIYGNFTVQNATQAVTLNAPTLQIVSGTLELNANTILATVNFAQLTTVDTLHYNALPALETTGLTTGITSANSVIIEDTGLTSLDGINVFQLGTFNVNNNGDIESINSGLESVTDLLSISYNAEKVDVVLDKLTSANNVIFQSVNSLSTKNLTSINGSLSVTLTSLDTLEFSLLKSIGNSLTIAHNDELESLDFPVLTSVGGAFQISDNPLLTSFDGFGNLSSIGGSVNINGTFDNGTFSALTKVAGGFTLKTDGTLSCSEFEQLNSSGDIKGDKYYCSGAGGASSSSSHKSGNSDSGSSTASGSSASGSSASSTTKAAEAPANSGKVAAVFAGFAAIGAALF
ncbi:3-prime end of extracellular mutant protein [Scheffersomyces coipomensis]|uniref:3-prime end of extracellular mutant protein n=1 Tax=Scheffersomyces coipomensis TaxID=1788519 RepID=UPI00315DF6A8